MDERTEVTGRPLPREVLDVASWPSPKGGEAASATADAPKPTTGREPGDGAVVNQARARSVPPPPEARAERQGTGRPRASGGLLRFSLASLRLVATVAILFAAVVAALLAWNYYVTAPWTRDGRVRVQVASVAPQVSGQITEVRIVDDQFVHKGDVLYVIDPFDFRIALQTARATLQQRAADLQVKRVQAERRQHLSDLATTPEEQQQYVGNATQAQAAFEAAQAQEAQAEVNLKRTQVTAPVNGFVTNLQMRVGDFAHSGTADVSVIDADSFWVDGYFEETKMARVCVGDVAEAHLMGYPAPIVGRVQSVARGISVSNAASGAQGLPSVDAVYTWVRLAQRVPVRVRIDDVPPGVPLVSGMTATVSIRTVGPPSSAPPWRRGLDGVATVLRALVDRPAPRPDCIPPVGALQGRTMTLTPAEPSPPRSADEIMPGLTPGMRLPPSRR